jgi:GntR family phosphonate transport system transcriptional regulator
MGEATVADALVAEIVSDLERDIRSRALAPGDRIPSELELGRKYMANRHAVRRALKELQDRGLLDASQGRGRFVRLPPANYTVRMRGGRFHSETRAAGLEPRVVARQSLVTAARGVVAQHLRVPERQPLAVIDRIHYANDVPVSVGRHFIHVPDAKAFIESYNRTASISETLAEFGIADYHRDWTHFSSRLPTPSEMETLNVPAHVPLFEMTFVNVDSTGAPVEYCQRWMPTDRTEIHIPFHPFATPPGA